MTISFMFPRFLRNRARQIMYLLNQVAFYVREWCLIFKMCSIRCALLPKWMSPWWRPVLSCWMPFGRARHLTNVSCLYWKGWQLKASWEPLGMWGHDYTASKAQHPSPNPWNYISYGFRGLIFPLRKAGLALVS